MKKYIIFVGSVVVVVASLYYTLTSVVAKGNPNYVSYEDLTNILQPQLNVLWDDIDSMKNTMTSLDQTVNDINRRLQIVEAELDN